MQQRVS